LLHTFCFNLGKMALRFLIACLVLSTSFASPLTNGQDCSVTLKAAGVSEKFPGIVAHGIHSITVEQLRKFKPDVTEKNSIPTINMDLLSDVAILSHAPNEPSVGKSFKTDGMRSLDQVLSHMDNHKYDIGRYDILERVAHSLHMQEVWYEAQSVYNKLKQQPPSSDVCKCALDIENNGVLHILRLIALQVREPEHMLGKYMTWKNFAVTWDANLSTYYSITKNDAKNPQEDKNNSLPPIFPPPPPVSSEAAWIKWKQVSMTMGEPSDTFELALYLYCALNA